MLYEASDVKVFFEEKLLYDEAIAEQEAAEEAKKEKKAAIANPLQR